MSNSFLPLVIPAPKPPLPILLSREARLLASFQSVASHTFLDPVADVKFSPVTPYDLAVANGFAVSLLTPQAGQVRKNFTRFRDVAYSPRYKSDGRLLVAGSGDGIVKVFDINSRIELRLLRGHKR